MIAAFEIALEAHDAKHGSARTYGVAADRDLFGTWILELRYSRIDPAGRRRLIAYANEDAARAEIRRRLKRRDSAPRRIGAVHQVVALADGSWRNGSGERI